MKYEFKNVSLDNYQLIYTDKEGKEKTIDFKKDVELASLLSSAQRRAKIRMYGEMKKMGYSKEDFVNKTTDGKGHITYDETELLEINKEYLEAEQSAVVMEGMELALGISLEKLLVDMGVDMNSNDEETINQVQLFMQKFYALGGEKTPSEK